MTYAERIAEGLVAPWVTDYATEADGARRSAQVAREEADTLARDDPRRPEVEAQATAWAHRAGVLESGVA